MKSRYTPLPKRKKHTGETGVQMSTPVIEPVVQIQPEITPIPLMQLATAFWAFKTLATAVDMDLFTHLSSSPMSAPELGRWFNIEERPAEMLLTGCAGLGLLEKQDGRYRNTPLADTFLARSARYYFGGFVRMLNQRLYTGWDKLPEAVRTNKPTTWDPDKQKSLFEGADPAMMATFWQAMHSLSILRRGLSAKPWISAVFESCSTWEAAPVPSTSNFVGDTRTCQRWYMTCRS